MKRWSLSIVYQAEFLKGLLLNGRERTLELLSSFAYSVVW